MISINETARILTVLVSILVEKALMTSCTVSIPATTNKATAAINAQSTASRMIYRLDEIILRIRSLTPNKRTLP
jgi:hypothetical protein